MSNPSASAPVTAIYLMLVLPPKISMPSSAELWLWMWLSVVPEPVPLSVRPWSSLPSLIAMPL